MSKVQREYTGTSKKDAIRSFWKQKRKAGNLILELTSLNITGKVSRDISAIRQL